MMAVSRFLSVVAATAALAIPLACAHASGGGSMGGGAVGGGGGVPESRRSPEQAAKSAYNDGVRLVHKADESSEDAAKATDAGKQKKYAEKAAKLYDKAKDSFIEAVGADGSLYQAWNYIGYTRRKLGDYSGALQAYDRALALNPGYSEAIEYRGHAYLGLNRLGDAKEAYLTLWSQNRELAAKLLGAMQDWVAKAAPGGNLDAAQIDSFKQWVAERTQVAAQTASLSPPGHGGSTSSWN